MEVIRHYFLVSFVLPMLDTLFILATLGTFTIAIFLLIRGFRPITIETPFAVMISGIFLFFTYLLYLATYELFHHPNLLFGGI